MKQKNNIKIVIGNFNDNKFKDKYIKTKGCYKLKSTYDLEEYTYGRKGEWGGPIICINKRPTTVVKYNIKKLENYKS